MTNAQTINEIRDAREQCYDDDQWERYKLYARNVGGASFENFEEADNGDADSELEFTERLVDDLGMLNELPDHLRFYFDYEAFARDLFITDYFSIEIPSGGVAVFRNV